jgi:haloalkane dehalogenase
VIRRGYADTPHGQQHYRLAGRRGGRVPLVLLHQTPSSSEMFAQVMPRLAADRLVVAPDLAGLGLSDAPDERLTVPVWAEALRATLGRLDLGRCAVLGHHTGASVAVELAASCPALVTRLILSGPPLVERGFLEARIPAVEAALVAGGAHLLAAWRRVGAKAPGLALALQHREAVAALAAGPRYAQAYRAVLGHDLGARLAAVACPTLVVAGPDDPLRPCVDAAMARLGAAAVERAILPRGGTYVFDEHPELIAGVVNRFLSKGDA